MTTLANCSGISTGQYLFVGELPLDNLVNILEILTREDGLILILIALLFADRLKAWIDFLIQAYTKWRNIDKKEATKSFESYTLQVAKVHEILEVYRKSLECARVAYYAFHNGGTDIRGVPFLKYSCVNEAVVYGVRPRLGSDKNAQIATIAHLAKPFIEGVPTIMWVKNIQHTTIKCYLEEHGVIKCAIMPIYEEDLLSGFITMEWRNEKYIRKTDEDIHDSIIQCAKMIEVNNVKNINHFLGH